MEYIWNNWFAIALLAPFFWSLVNVLDIYFVSQIYEDSYDGVLISALFQLLPWVLAVFGVIHFQFPGIEGSLLALSAGACLAFSYFFYFKTLFASNDGVVVQIIWNLSVPFVPFLAWLIAGERLSPIHYAGITLAFTGVLLFSINQKIQARHFKKVFTIMLGAVFFLSLSMVMQALTYEIVGHDFWTGFLLFSLGVSVCGFFIAFFHPKPVQERLERIMRYNTKYLLLFISAEFFNLFGVFTSQRAIDLSPSVSFVVVIESLSPIFIMFFSFILALVFLLLKRKVVESIYRDQLVSFKTKMLACCIIAVGIYLIH